MAQNTSSQFGGSTRQTRRSYLKESTWLLMSTAISGSLMLIAHPLVATFTFEEYAAFFLALKCIILLSVPASALQLVFAATTADGESGNKSKTSVGDIRRAIRGVFYFWIAVCVPVFYFSGEIASAFRLPDKNLILAVLVAALFALWLAVFQGMLQGGGRFWDLGWTAILSAATRISLILIALSIDCTTAVAGVAAAAIGYLVALAFAVQRCSSVWEVGQVELSPIEWLHAVSPYAMCAAVLGVLATADVTVVNLLFSPAEAAYYAPAQIVGFAVVQAVTPFITVMFPKLIKGRSDAKGIYFQMSLSASGCIGIFAIVLVTFFPGLPIRTFYLTRPEFEIMASEVPWFTWAMLLFSLSSILVNTLLAEKKWAVLPWISLVATAYLFTLAGASHHLASLGFRPAFHVLAQLLFTFCLLLFLVSVLFSKLNTQRTGTIDESGSTSRG